jgi:penicillin-binding protein 1B
VPSVRGSRTKKPTARSAGRNAPRKAPAARRRRSRSGGGVWIALLAVLIFVLGAAGIYLWRLDRDVVERFESNRFTIPSSVYSAPTEIRVGIEIDRAALVSLLRAHGYSPAADKNVRTGEYALGKGRQLDLATHAVTVPGKGEQSPRRLRLDFGPAGLQSIRDTATGREIARFMLEPIVLGRFYGARHETRELVAYAEIRPRFVPALLAAEDGRFFEHPGIDIWGVLRAAVVNISQGGVRQGGSTITQQLVKNLWLTPDRTFQRKINEAAMSLLLERHYGKTEILETYANVIYLGQSGRVSLYGVGEAARHYFGRKPEDMTWGEAATLAGLIRSPGQNSPFTQPQRSKQRRDQVLDRLFELRFLDANELAAAKAEVLRTTPPPAETRRAPYFVDYVSRGLQGYHQMEELQTAGLRVYTTLSAPLQLAAEEAVHNGVAYLQKNNAKLKGLNLQAALISIEPRTGRIVAYVGGIEYGTSQFDRVEQARRQIGSLVKPFIVYAALEAGHAPASLWSNETIAIKTAQGNWSPYNYNKQSGGEVTMRAALEQSLNLPTVRMAMDVGLGTVQKTLRAAGVEGAIPVVPALSLGAVEASPLEMARAFGTLATLGRRPEPHAIDFVADSQHRILRKHFPESREVLAAAPAYMTTQILTGVIERGTGVAAKRVTYHGDMAGKTGTTSDYRDAWFVGYTPSLVTVVWVGTDKNVDIGLPGSRLALPIWGEYMLTAVNWQEPERFQAPEGVQWVEVDPATGQLAGESCPQKVRELYLTEKIPQQRCEKHGTIFEQILNLFR